MDVAINKIVDQYFPKKPTLLQQFLESVRLNYDTSKLKGTYDQYGRLTGWRDDDDEDEEENDRSYSNHDDNNFCITTASSSSSLIPATSVENNRPNNNTADPKLIPSHIFDYYNKKGENHHQPHKSYALAFKLEAINMAKSQGNRQAARYYGISESQVRDWSQKEEDLLKLMNSPEGTRRFRLRGGGRKKKYCQWSGGGGGDGGSPPPSMVSMKQPSCNVDADTDAVVDVAYCQQQAPCTAEDGLKICLRRGDDQREEACPWNRKEVTCQNSLSSNLKPDYTSCLQSLTNSYEPDDEDRRTSPAASESDFDIKGSDFDCLNSSVNVKNEMKLGISAAAAAASSNAPEFLRDLGLALVMSEYGKPPNCTGDDGQDLHGQHPAYRQEASALNLRQKQLRRTFYNTFCNSFYENEDCSDISVKKIPIYQNTNIDDNSGRSLASSPSDSNDEFRDNLSSTEKSGGLDASGKKPTLLQTFLQSVLLHYKKLKGVYDEQGHLLEWHDDENDEDDNSGKSQLENNNTFMSNLHNSDYSETTRIAPLRLVRVESQKFKLFQQQHQNGNNKGFGSKNDLGFMLEVVDFAKKWGQKNAYRYFGINQSRIQEWILQKNILLEMYNGNFTSTPLKREIPDYDDDDDDVVELSHDNETDKNLHLYDTGDDAENSNRAGFSGRQKTVIDFDQTSNSIKGGANIISSLDYSASNYDCHDRLRFDEIIDVDDDSKRRKFDLSFKLEALKYAKMYGKTSAMKRYCVSDNDIQEWLLEESELISNGFSSTSKGLQNFPADIDGSTNSSYQIRDRSDNATVDSCSLSRISENLYSGDSAVNNVLSEEANLHKDEQSNSSDTSPNSELIRLRQRLYPGPVTYQQKRKFNVDFKLMAIGYAKQYGNAAACRSFDLDRKQIRGWRKQEALFLEAKMSSNDSLTCFRLRGGGRKPSISKDFNYSSEMIYRNHNHIHRHSQSPSFYSEHVKTEMEDSEDSDSIEENFGSLKAVKLEQEEEEELL